MLKSSYSTVKNAIITLTNALDDKGRHFKSRFIKPGLAGYPGQFGNALIQKETLDRFVHTLRNKPVIIGHKDKIKDEDKAGEVFNIWFNPEDGWYWCDGIITDKTAQNLIENKGWSVSCAYDYTKADTSGGTENNIPYDIEFLDGEFNHLALVDNPRYEGANIVFNSKVENEDKWITIKPNGEENKGRHLLVKEGETVGEALLRTYGDKNQQKLFDTSDYKMSKDEIKKTGEERKQANKTHEKIKDIEDILKDSVSKYTIGEKSLEILKDDLKKLKEKGLKDTDSEDSFEKETEQKQEQEQPKEDKKENTSIDQYITDKSEKGRLYQTKGTTTYSNAGKRAEVEEFGEDGGKYQAVFYDGSKRKDIKVYSTKRGMEKAVREHLSGETDKETKALETKTDLNAAEAKYKEVLKRYKENDSKRWQSGLSNQEYYKAYDEAEKAKKELTVARREYAESIMANFKAAEENPYEERQAARKERYEELSQQAQKTSDSYSKRGQEMFDVIPFGQPIHGQRDRNYRDRAWGKFEQSWKEQKKADYYADKTASVGKAGISADDANAIAKLAEKYKSGVDSAEKRRIIDRVIDIHSRASSTKPESEATDYGFRIERNKDLNRLQLKFDDIPDANTRSILKSNGFRWSPREKAWQRQLNGNSESSLKSVMEKMKVENSINTIVDAVSEVIADCLGEYKVKNKKDEGKWITIKGNHIFLKDGESIADAFKKITGVSIGKTNKNVEKKDNHKPSKAYSEILAKTKKDSQRDINKENIIDNAVKNLKLDKNKVLEKIKFAEGYNEGINNKKLDTQKLYSNDKGEYKRERAELHKEILGDIFKNKEKAKPKNGAKPTVVFLGGRGGSGKSKFNGLVYDKDNFIVLDADEIKEKLPEYRGYNAFEVHEESSDILNQAINKAKKEGLNVVIDATMKTLNSTESKVRSFDNSGYNIEMYYMHLPREKAAERAIGRFMGDRGRYVPLSILLKMKDNEDNFDKLKKYASKWAFYNNDVPRKEDQPILIDKNY